MEKEEKKYEDQEKYGYEEYVSRIIRCPETGFIGAQYISPRDNPDIHYSPTSPAICKWDERGNIIEMTWFNSKGEMHRDGDLPTIIERCGETGKDVYFCYMLHNLRHRDNGKPAILCMHPDTGIAYKEQYWVHGKCSLLIERDPISGGVVYGGPPRPDDLEVDVTDDSKFKNNKLPRVSKLKSPKVF